MADEEAVEEPPPPTITVFADELVDKIRTAPAAMVAEILPIADVNGMTEGGDSPLVCAASGNRVELVGRLLQAGASPDSQTSTGLTALAAAATDGHVACVVKLIAAGADINLQGGREKSTALLLAARGGHRNVCEKLLDAGADTALENAYGETAESAAHRFETEGRLHAYDFKVWEDEVAKRAAAIDAQPPPPPPLFPLDPVADLTRWYRSTDPTKMLWRPGAWVHMKRPACGPVMVQERPRAFEATGYGVKAPAIPPENSVFPAEGYGYASSVRHLQSDTPDARTAAARIALERTTLNPQMFVDDVAPTERSLVLAVSDASVAFKAIKKQEAKLWTAFPDLPLRIGNAPTYSSGLQRATMPTPTAAATLHPMLEPPSTDSLSALLRKPPVAAQPDEDAAEPPVEEAAPAKGKKK